MSDVTDGSKETDSAPLRHGMNTVAPSEHVVLSARLQTDPMGYRRGEEREIQDECKGQRSERARGRTKT